MEKKKEGKKADRDRELLVESEIFQDLDPLLSMEF
jgi:hypothetical protein